MISIFIGLFSISFIWTFFFISIYFLKADELVIKGVPYVDLFGTTNPIFSVKLKQVNDSNIIIAYGVNIKVVRIIKMSPSFTIDWVIHATIPDPVDTIDSHAISALNPMVLEIIEDLDFPQINVIIMGSINYVCGFVMRIIRNSGVIEKSMSYYIPGAIFGMIRLDNTYYGYAGKSGIKFCMIGKLLISDLSESSTNYFNSTDYAAFYSIFSLGSKLIVSGRELTNTKMFLAFPLSDFTGLEADIKSYPQIKSPVYQYLLHNSKNALYLLSACGSSNEGLYLINNDADLSYDSTLSGTVFPLPEIHFNVMAFNKDMSTLAIFANDTYKFAAFLYDPKSLASKPLAKQVSINLIPMDASQNKDMDNEYFVIGKMPSNRIVVIKLKYTTYINCQNQIEVFYLLISWSNCI